MRRSRLLRHLTDAEIARGLLRGLIYEKDGWLLPSVSGAALCTAGFEDGVLGAQITTADGGDATEWDSATHGASSSARYSNTFVHAGALSAKLTGDSVTPAILKWTTAFGTQTDHYGRIYIYCESNPGSTINLIRGDNGAAGAYRIQINSSGLIELLNNAGSIVGTFTTPIGLDQWVRVEFHVVHDATNGTIEAKLFNQPEDTTPTETVSVTPVATEASSDSILFRNNVSSYAFYLDDIVAGDSTWPGPIVTPYEKTGSVSLLLSSSGADAKELGKTGSASLTMAASGVESLPSRSTGSVALTLKSSGHDEYRPVRTGSVAINLAATGHKLHEISGLCPEYYLLLEDGFAILLEDGGFLLLDASIICLAPPEITGQLKPGRLLDVTEGVWDDGGGTATILFTYQWQSATSPTGPWVDIPGATENTWRVTGHYLGDWLRVIVTGHCGDIFVECISLVVGPITAAGPIGGELGCGEYEAFVFTRGGGMQVAVLPWTSLNFTRVLDDTSTGSVSGAIGQDGSCCDFLADVYPWRHELVIKRDGVTVWVGPIYSLQTPPGEFQIDARDLSAWWDHRRIRTDIEYAETDLAVIFTAIAQDAMSADDSPNFTVRATACGVRGTRRILALQHQLAGPALRDLSTTGIDWTMVGREARVGGLVVPTEPLATFIDAYFANPPTPIRDGSQQANSITTRGAGGGELGDSLYAIETDGFAARDDGLLENVESVTTLVDFNSITQYSKTQLALRKVMLTADSARLTPQAPYNINDLIPGALCPLALQETCLPVRGDYRIKSVSVSVSAGQDDAVDLTFQPPGTTEVVA